MKYTRCIGLFFFLMLLFIPLGLAEKDYYWESIDSQVSIRDDGSLDVVETQTFVFTGPFTYAYRYFHYDEIDAIENIHVYEGDDEITSVDVYKEGDFLVVRWGYDAADETRTFRLEYTLLGAISEDDERQDLFYTAVFKDHEKPVETATLTVRFPSDVVVSDLKIETVPATLAEVVDARTVRMEVEDLAPYEVFDVKLNFPALVALPTLALYVIILVVLFIFVILAVPIMAFVRAKKVHDQFGKDPTIRDGDSRLAQLRLLKPAVVGTIMDDTAGIKEIMATVIDLAQRGYIFIQEEKKGLWGKDFTLSLMKSESSLALYEKEVLNAIFSTKKSVKLSELKNIFYTKIPKLEKLMYNQAMDHKLYDKNPNTVRRSYMLGAGKYVFALVVAGLIGFSNTSFLVVAFGIFAPVVLLIYGMIIYLKSLDREGKTKVDIALKKSSFFNVEVGLIITLLILLILLPNREKALYTTLALLSSFCAGAVVLYYAHRMPKLTLQGALYKKKYEDLRQYLKTYQLREERIFNEFLPYTIAFGIQDYWIKKFQDLTSTPGAETRKWYSGGMTSSSFGTFMKSMNSSFVTSPKSSGSGGGFGGGGGAGGGGGGAG